MAGFHCSRETCGSSEGLNVAPGAQGFKSGCQQGIPAGQISTAPTKPM